MEELTPELKAIFSSGEVLRPEDDYYSVLFQRHLAAYRFCRDFCEGKHILDLGCGEGYGSSYIAKAAASVVGVDVSPELVAYANQRYGNETLSYEVADGTALPYPDGKFEGVISLQVIEHIKHYHKYLSEVERVLKPGGFFLCITPNCLTMLSGLNPYHYKEFRWDELKLALEQHFSEVEMRGLFGSKRYLELKADEQKYARKIVALDPLQLRRILPRFLLKIPYKIVFILVNRFTDKNEKQEQQTEITIDDFTVESDNLNKSLELIGIGFK